MVTRSVTRSVTQPVAIPFALAGRSMLRLPYRGASLALAFDSQKYAMGAIGKRPAAFAFSDLITFTRASGGGRFNAQGQYEWLPANVPRIDYDPVTGECLGLLVEEQRTNLLTYSDDFSKAAWAKTNIGLEAVADGYKIWPVGPTTTFTRVQNVVLGAALVGRVNTVSFEIEAAGWRYVQMHGGGNEYWEASANFDLLTGATNTTGSVTASAKRGKGNRWRISATFTAAAAGNDGTATICFVPALNSARGAAPLGANDSDGVIIYASDNQVGAFPTSHIPTTDAQVTRAADVPSVNVLSPWFNPEAGTFFVEWVQPPLKSNGQQTVFDLNDGTTGNRIAGLVESNSTIFQSRYAVGGSVLPNRSAPAAAPGIRCRAALAFSNGTQEFAFNGAIFGSGAIAGTLGLVSAMRVGGGLGGALNSHIRSIRYFPRRLSDTELQALTT